MRYLILTATLLCASCGTSELMRNADQTVKDAAVVAKAARDAVVSVKESLRRPDGTTDNSSGAWIGAILGALPAAWIGVKKVLDTRKALTDTKKGLTAAVDAAEALPPDAAKLFKQAAASSAHMTPDVAAMIAAIKAR